MPTWNKNKTPEAEPVVFWCQLWHADDDNPHGAARNSPSFSVQSELTAWIHANRREGDVIHPYQRAQTAGGFRNERLLAREAPIVDASGKVVTLVAELVKTRDLK